MLSYCIALMIFGWIDDNMGESSQIKKGLKTGTTILKSLKFGKLLYICTEQVLKKS